MHKLSHKLVNKEYLLSPYCFVKSHLHGTWTGAQTWGIMMDWIQIRKHHRKVQILTDCRTARAPSGLQIQLRGPHAPGCTTTTYLAPSDFKELKELVLQSQVCLGLQSAQKGRVILSLF
jgi:hypothetical protein